MNKAQSKTNGKTIAVVAASDRSYLSKAQKTFNTLIKAIEKSRARLADWEVAIHPYQQRYVNELLPLSEGIRELRFKMVHRLDQTHDREGLTKSERRMIADIITNISSGILAENDDAEVKAIYNKHSHSDYDKEGVASINGMKSMLEDVLGVDLGDNLDLNSPEDLMARAKAHMEEQAARYEADKQAREARRAKRKKTAKQLAREAEQLANEARKQAKEQQVSQSIREVFRKLVSALHPDREPDTDERARKTALMQRVNQAYEKRNLLELLKLQLELEHIDQATVNTLSEDRLKQYNIILKEQLAELEREIWHVKNRFSDQFGLEPFSNPSPNTIMRDLDREIHDVGEAIEQMKVDLAAFEDIKQVKVWLKTFRRQARYETRADLFDDNDDCPF